MQLLCLGKQTLRGERSVFSAASSAGEKGRFVFSTVCPVFRKQLSQSCSSNPVLLSSHATNCLNYVSKGTYFLQDYGCSLNHMVNVVNWNKKICTRTTWLCLGNKTIWLGLINDHWWYVNILNNLRTTLEKKTGLLGRSPVFVSPTSPPRPPYTDGLPLALIRNRSVIRQKQT